MSIFDRFLGRENHKEEPPVKPEQEPQPEIVPEHSPETLEIIEQIDGKIGESKNLLGGLGRVAREKILTDPKELEEIYAKKEMKLGLKGKYDAFALESASEGLLIRNAIKRVVTLGLAGSKYALKDKDNWLVDKRKLEDKFKGKKYKLSPDELVEAAEQAGLKQEEIKPEDFKKTYVKGERGAEKIISRKTTEREADETAGDILTRRLTDLETKTGPDLIKQKQGLEGFKKETDENKSVFEPADLEKFAEEARAREELIKDKQQDLDSNLEIIRSPLLEQQRGLTEAIEGFSPLLKEATGKEDGYKAEIRDLQDKMNKISRTKEISKSQTAIDRMKQWAEQKAQAEVNLKDFREKKEALNKRLMVLKEDKARVDSTLARINKIGKTPTELSEERKKEQARKNLPSEPSVSGNLPDNAPVGSPAQEAGDELDELAGEAAGEPTAADSGTEDKDANQTAAGQPKNQAVNEPAQVRSQAEAVVPPVAEIIAPAQRQEEVGREAEQKENAPLVSYWLNKIFKVMLESDADTVMKKHFRLKGKAFMKTAPMTLGQALRAYTGFRMEFKRQDAFAAWETAEKHFRRTFKDDDYIIRQLDAAQEKYQAIASKQAEASDAPEPAASVAETPRPRQEDIGKDEKIDIKLTAEESRQIYSPEKAEALARAQTSAAPAPEQGGGGAEPAEAKKWQDELEQAMNEGQIKLKRGSGSDADRAALASSSTSRSGEPEAGGKLEVEVGHGTEAPATAAPNSERAEDDEPEQKVEIAMLPPKKLLSKLGLKKGTPEEKRAIKENFSFDRDSLVTRKQAEKAYLKYLKDTNSLGDMPEDVAKKKIEQLIAHIYGAN